MKTTYRCLALVVAIFWLPVMAHAQKESDATRILNNVFSAYSRMASYQDEGLLVLTSDEPTGGRIEKMPFKTFFKRPNLFRFEWIEYTITKLGRTKIIWFNGKEAFMYWEPDEYEQKESLGLAVGSAAGISHGAINTVSDLLMPDELGGSRLKQLSKISVVGEEVIDGVNCYHIKANSGGDPYELWVGKTDFLIRKRREERQIGDTLWITEETRKKIQVAQPIPEVVFNYKPPIPLTPQKDVDTAEIDRFLNPGPPAWSEFTSEEGRFSLLMPQKPISTASTVETSQGRFDTKAFIARHGTVDSLVCMAGYTDISSKILVANDVDGFFDGFRDQFIKETGGKLVSEKSSTLYGHSGREIKMQLFRGELRVRLFVVGNRLYQLVVIKSDKVEASDEEMFNKFFDSFKLLTVLKPVAAKRVLSFEGFVSRLN